jgi:muramoyltetrapeptide carboxypeptidase
MATRPPILRAGDTIGIVTLGSPLEPAVIDADVATLRQMGFNVVLGDYVYSYAGYLAATDEQRASDLMRMFQDPAVRMILPTRGGVGVAGILPYLDYEYIALHPKIISGYSDITVLLNVLTQYANLITFHSLMLIDFRPDTPAYNFNQFFAAVSTNIAPRLIQNPPGMNLVGRVPGNVTAPVVGGNLTSFIGTLGTPFEIDTRMRILFLEDTHEPINTIYRYIDNLKLAGKFDDCAGILLGQCSNCVPAYDRDYESLITDVIVPLGKPLMTNLASGHGEYKATVPLGAVINMNTVNATLTILEPTVTAQVPSQAQPQPQPAQPVQPAQPTQPVQPAQPMQPAQPQQQPQQSRMQTNNGNTIVQPIMP